MRARNVMTTNVVTARVDTPYKQLVETMLEHGVSGLPIVDDAGRLLGIVTEADLVGKQAFGEPPKRLLGMLHQVVFGPPSKVLDKAWALDAAGLMTESVHTADPDEDVSSVARRLLERSVKRLPVVNKDAVVVGIISRRDLLAAYGRPDEEIKRDIYRTLTNLLAVPEDAEVDDVHVRNGHVVIFGRVTHPSDIRVVEGAVRGVPGVISVTSRLFAREPEATLNGALESLKD